MKIDSYPKLHKRTVRSIKNNMLTFNFKLELFRKLMNDRLMFLDLGPIRRRSCSILAELLLLFVLSSFNSRVFFNPLATQPL